MEEFNWNIIDSNVEFDRFILFGDIVDLFLLFGDKVFIFVVVEFMVLEVDCIVVGFIVDLCGDGVDFFFKLYLLFLLNKEKI